jgi:hypothetical protein
MRELRRLSENWSVTKIIAGIWDPILALQRRTLWELLGQRQLEIDLVDFAVTEKKPLEDIRAHVHSIHNFTYDYNTSPGRECKHEVFGRDKTTKARLN